MEIPAQWIPSTTFDWIVLVVGTVLTSFLSTAVFYEVGTRIAAWVGYSKGEEEDSPGSDETADPESSSDSEPENFSLNSPTSWNPGNNPRSIDHGPEIYLKKSGEPTEKARKMQEMCAKSEDFCYKFLKRSPDGTCETIPIVGYPDSGQTFEPVFPSGLSLESCEGDPNSRYIQFTSHVVLENGFANLKSPGSLVRTQLIPLYFNHVLYSFKLVVESNNDNGFDFYLFCDGGAHLSSGSKYDGRSEVLDNLNTENDIKELKPPNLLRVKMNLYNNKGDVKETIVLKKRKNFNNIFESPKPVAKSAFLLSSRTSSDKNNVDFHCELQLYVERDYFSINRLVKDHMPIVPSDENVRKKVQRILSGERIENATWAILIDGSKEKVGGLTKFYVEESNLIANTNFEHFKNSGKPDGIMTIDQGRKEILLHGFNTEDIQIFIPLLYGEKCPYLSSWTVQNTIVQNMLNIFKSRKFVRMASDWENEIVTRALAIDPHNDSAESWVEIMSLLSTVFNIFYGLMPLAKRVAIGVLADMMHLHISEKKWLNCPDAIFGKIYKHDFALTQQLFLHFAFHSAMLHEHKVRAVRKQGLNALPK